MRTAKRFPVLAIALIVALVVGVLGLAYVAHQYTSWRERFDQQDKGRIQTTPAPSSSKVHPASSTSQSASSR